MNLVKEEEKKEYDNFDFQVDIIKKIHNWVTKNNLTADDAFRVIDNDFDGFLSRNDLAHFLKNVLHYSEKELTSSIVDRLFKLMDQFKRGCIQVNDFRKVLEHDVDSAMNLTISGFKKIKGRSTFDWRINAR